MKKNNNKKRKAYFNAIMWILLFTVPPPIIGYLFQGPKIFSSFSYYLTYTSIGYAYGLGFGLGNSLIGNIPKNLTGQKIPKGQI
jgi:hypothetical protein